MLNRNIHQPSTTNTIQVRLSKTDTASVFQRVVERRGYEVSTLKLSTAQDILRQISELTGETLTATTSDEAAKTVNNFLQRQYQTICDTNTSSRSKRRAHDLLSELFRIIEEKFNENMATEIENYGETRHKKRRLSANRGSLQLAAAAAASDVSSQTTTANTTKSTNNLAITTATSSTKIRHAPAATNENNIANRPLSSSFQQQATTPATSASRCSVGNTDTTSVQAAAAHSAPNGLQSKDPNSSTSSSSKSRVGITMNGSTRGENTSNNTKPRSIASLIAVSAATAALARQSIETATQLDAAIPSATNMDVVPLRDRPTTPPPVYEKRSSNAIAQKELHMRKQRKENQSDNTSITSNINQRTTQRTVSSSCADILIEKAAKTVSEPRNQASSTMLSSRPTFAGTTHSETLNAKSTTASVKTNGLEYREYSPSAPMDMDAPISVMIPIIDHVISDEMDISDSDDDTGTDGKNLTDATISQETVRMLFPADRKGAFSCTVDSRAAVNVQFRKRYLTKPQIEKMAARFARWDPFWDVKKILIAGVTVPIEKTDLLSRPSGEQLDCLKTAGSFKVSHLWHSVKDLLSRKSCQPVNGEYRLVVRMIPLHPTEYSKKKRADCHLWPLGTYLQISTDNASQKFPQILAQRKQQSHDLSKWLYQCKPLDITSFVQGQCKDAGSVTFELCSHDTDPFIFSLSLCRYRTPQTLALDQLPGLKRLSLESRFQKIKDMMKNNEVSLDSDEENDGGTDKLSHSLFSLQDRSLKTVIVTPVRGKKCRHFSCFDFEAFLHINQNAHGQRWKCTNCELFLSTQDLEYCELTKFALDNFKDYITSDRHMVKIREDRHMELTKPARSRAERERARNAQKKLSQQAQGRAEPEIIEIDLD
ncbi:MIZ/SP-ring zinc finger domain containing protein [Nitzschia inconspicua]|uniref:MIZ/SP-ring zinc finger domain containing protein n=1 Tax=Nitzschia inconspicua TaxID=303405 RepID=A0A9K3PED3_9STRA|nr:MIZ/SP-ring zinc finger domain containing protein [Nitzschia inconspicua]